MPRRLGLTLIELLAAVSLAAALTVAVMGLLGRLSRDCQMLKDEYHFPAWRTRLAKQFEWDFKNSRRVAINAAEVRLFGYAARDPISGQPTHRPTRITYYFGGTEKDPVLQRREEWTDSRTNRNSSTELLSLGVASIELITPSGPTRPAEILRAEGFPYLPVPNLIQIVLRDRHGKATYNETLILR